MHKNSALTGYKRLILAFQNSRAGLCDIWHREEAFRLEIVALLLAIPSALMLGNGWSQIALLVGSILMLIIVEILNSAIEAVVDRIGPEIHELSRIAKDLGSAAVFLTAIFPLVIWSAIILDWMEIIKL